MSLTACPPDALAELWPLVRPLLQSAVDHGLGELTADDVLERAKQGTMFVYLAIDGDGRITGAMACEFVRYPRAVSLNVTLLSGKGMIRAVVEGFALLKDLAKSGGATYLECRSRDSVAKLLQRAFGARAQYTVSVLEI